MNRQADTAMGWRRTDEPVAESAGTACRTARQGVRGLAKAPNGQGWNYWATAGGNSGVASGDPVVGSAALGYKSGNFAVGLDSQGDPDVLMGFALGGVAGSFAVPDRETSGNIIGGHAGAYGARKWGQFYIDGSLAMDLYSNTTDRFTSVPRPDRSIRCRRSTNTGPAISQCGLRHHLEAGWRQHSGQAPSHPLPGCN